MPTRGFPCSRRRFAAKPASVRSSSSWNFDSDRWPASARARVEKLISFLLRHLPDDNFYRIVYVRRHLDEVLRSQDKRLDRLANAAPGADLETMKEAYRNDIVAARLVNRFLGGHLDEAAMAAVVVEKLYRNRA